MARARILVVEDEAIVARSIGNRLEKAQYAVPAIVSSGEDAIDEADQRRPDLVLMDIKLRGTIDGIDAAREIYERFDIPIVYLTAYADDETLHRAKQAEPFGYILKPFDAEELRVTIEIALYKHAMQRRLRESEERYRLLADNATDMIARQAPDGTYRYVSPASRALLGYEPSELLGRRAAEFIHPDDLTVLEGAQGCPDEAPRENRFEYRLRRRSGEYCWVESTVQPVPGTAPDEGGEFVCVLRDISERKRAEDERKRLEQQMQRTQKLESLGLLAGGTAHHMNSLLMAILGNAELALMEAEVSQHVQECIRHIQESGRRAARLMEQIAAFSGKTTLVSRPMDLNEAVGEVALLVEASTPKATTFRTSLGADVPPILADPTQLRQVILNLLTNATEAIGDTEGTVTIETGVRLFSQEDLDGQYSGENLAANTYVWLTVGDTGCGMEQSACPRIFEPFYTTKFQGRGMGLATALGVIKAHGGAIRVDTAPQRGTVFEMILPVSEGNGEAAHP